jgi:hypothetical protein
MAAPVLQFKRGLLANLPGLRAGEPGFATDSYDLYVGLTSETSTNKFLGSHRYWTKNTTTTGSGVNLVEGTDNGSEFITIKSPDSLSGIATYVMPASGSADQILKISSISGGIYTLAFAAPAASSFTLAADSGSNDTFNTGETLTFTGGEGIDTIVSDNAITIAAEDATDANKGIASFDSGDFSVTSGAVSLADSATGAVIAISGTTDEIEVSRTNGTVTIGLPDDVTVGGGLTATTFTLAGVAVTAILDEDTLTSDRADALATQQSIKAYVDTQVGGVDVTLGIDADSGGPSTVTTSQTLTVSGTLNQVETTVSGQSITVSLADDVTIPGDLQVTGNDIKDSGGSAALTFDGSQNTTANANLTVTGNLYVNGSTTQVNTASMVVEDRTIELGMVDGSAPSSATTWDLGVLFNYHSTSAKKAAVAWEGTNDRFVFGSQVSDGGGTGTGNPQLTFTEYAAIEIGSLWVNDCAGQSQVINCSGGVRTLENITIDGGSF